VAQKTAHFQANGNVQFFGPPGIYTILTMGLIFPIVFRENIATIIGDFSRLAQTELLRTVADQQRKKTINPLSHFYRELARPIAV